jgi:hypothetical protein
MSGRARAVPAERPWWWPSSWDMGRAWQIVAMFIVLWWFLCWQHGPDAMARFAWQACPFCEGTTQ